jgi:hypothetical protein
MVLSAKNDAQILRRQHPGNAVIVCDEEAAPASAEDVLGDARHRRGPVHGHAVSGHDAAHAHAAGIQESC